jgi:L-lactate dehydrogenase (cytochrome)
MSAGTGSPRRLKNILSLDDFEEAARGFLPRPIFGFVSGAAETGASLRDNRAAFAEFAFLPRVLNDVSKRSQKVNLLGRSYAAPFGIAPMGTGAIVAYRADLVLAASAAAAGIPLVMSGSSLIRLEDVAAVAPGTWFQAYLPGDPARAGPLIGRVAAAGFDTLMITVDVAASANRENNIRSGFRTPLRPSLRLFLDGAVRPRWSIGTFLRTIVQHGMPHFENATANRGAPVMSRHALRDLGQRDHLNWEHFALIRRQWKGKLLIKGILHPDDARLARENGADGVVVSNHGGRQLDGAIAPLRVLPRIVDAVAGLPVMLDGGVRRGADVLKALALGASSVFVGRPFLYAAAIAGDAGVRHAIRLLSAEIDRNMALLGLNSIDELGPDAIERTAGHLQHRGI